MSKPETDDSKIQNLLQRIREKSSQGEYVYRGESEQYDKISSTLYRKYKDEIQAKEFDILIAQKEMLEQVKAYTDFTDETDMLTELQHYGGKTNLIDFTTDYLIALFFACDGSFEQAGRIILLNKKSNQGRISSPKKNLNNRVISQKSIFFQSPKGYLDEEDSAIEIISIPQEMKQPVLDYLIKYHDIARHAIYNDILGYIQDQEKHQFAYTEFYIGLTFQDQGKHEEAIKHYDEAIRINPQDADAYNNRGNAKFALGLHHDAIADCDRAIHINPQFALAYYNRGIAKRELGRHEAAITDHNEAIRINPQYAGAYNDRGIAKGMLGRYEEAIADFNEAIRINPQFVAAYCNRGNAHKEIGVYEKARVDLQRAFELATEQGNQKLAQDAQRLLDELPPASGED
ncbi:MAG: tetratricopeptide repeat protein [Nitrospira sp.]|nr:tetratricopeptide repeat protein [Nitrospira sp.]